VCDQSLDPLLSFVHFETVLFCRAYETLKQNKEPLRLTFEAVRNDVSTQIYILTYLPRPYVAQSLSKFQCERGKGKHEYTTG